MNRFAAVALVFAVVGPAVAGDPLPRQVPGSPYRQVQHADVSTPLNTVMSAAPTMTADQCDPNSGSCGPTGCRSNRPLISRFCDWIFFQPGPRCAPTFVLTPYAAPFRTYFHCKSDCYCLVGGCQTACGDTSCGPRLRSHAIAPRGMLGLRSQECRTGLFARLFGGSCQYGSPSGYGSSELYVGQNVGYQAYGGAGLAPTTVAPVYTGTGLRFASPTNGLQAASRPFTNP